LLGSDGILWLLFFDGHILSLDKGLYPGPNRREEVFGAETSSQHPLRRWEVQIG
jgi:hypothetical protein